MIKYRICWQLLPEYGEPVFFSEDEALQAIDEAPELYDGYNAWVEAVEVEEKEGNDD